MLVPAQAVPSRYMRPVSVRARHTQEAQCPSSEAGAKYGPTFVRALCQSLHAPGVRLDSPSDSSNLRRTPLTSSDPFQLGALDCERRALVSAADDLHLVAPLHGIPLLDARCLVVVLPRRGGLEPEDDHHRSHRERAARAVAVAATGGGGCGGGAASSAAAAGHLAFVGGGSGAAVRGSVRCAVGAAAVDGALECGELTVVNKHAHQPLLRLLRRLIDAQPHDLHVGLLPIAAVVGHVFIADGRLDLVPERKHRAGEQVLVLDAPAHGAAVAVLAVLAVAAVLLRLGEAHGPVGLGLVRSHLFEAAAVAKLGERHILAQPGARPVDLEERHGVEREGRDGLLQQQCVRAEVLLLAPDQRARRAVEALARERLLEARLVHLLLHHLGRVVEGDAAVDAHFDHAQLHLGHGVLAHALGVAWLDLDGVAADVDDTVVELVVVLGLLDLGVELRGEVAEDAVLHAHLHAEHAVEEVLDAELVLGDAGRAEGVVCLLEVRLPPLLQVAAAALEPEGVAHVRRRREGGRVCRLGHHAHELRHRLAAPPCVDVELRQVGGVGGAPIAARERAEGLQPLGHRRCEPPLTATCRHHEDVLRAVDLVGAVRAAALLDGLVGAPRQLERDVHAAAAVLHAAVGLQRDAGGGGLGDDGHELLARHEGRLLVQVDALHRDVAPRGRVGLAIVALDVLGLPRVGVAQ
mmetsp:Transcript_21706/g.51477  ORF Transcript_21706/g.51477 Transcript_21706/m.51477 type:complete len:693 (-) Transcript_21706:330-2408(-)